MQGFPARVGSLDSILTLKSHFKQEGDVERPL